MQWQNGGQGPITLGVMSLDMFSNLAILENFRNIFLRNYESQKLKVRINIDNGWMYCVYQNDVLCILEVGANGP